MIRLTTIVTNTYQKWLDSRQPFEPIRLLLPGDTVVKIWGKKSRLFSSLTRKTAKP